MRRKLITSALPYVNNVPHLGNLIQVLSADVYARFCRLRGYETLYVCGTDEYGTATETRAAEEGISPRELCDRYNAIHDSIYKWFNISFDHFGRTSTDFQTEIVQDIFRKLDEAGYIVEHTEEQLYCPTCQRFLADRYVRGICPNCAYEDARGDQCEACGKLLEPSELRSPRCSSCGGTPEARNTSHLYIDLPAIRPKLEKWLSKACVEGHWAYNAIQMTQAWIRDGLRERAITRDLKWGIPVPKKGYESKVFYVWFDAPIGYISISAAYAAAAGKDWKAFIDEWWKNPESVDLFQFIGKDNIPFHTVIFPSSLLGSGERWTMLHHMSSSEYLNYESGKFSKSKGIGVFGTDAKETGIPADVWRFYIYYNRPEKADAVFTWKDFQEKVNGELIGNLGNLVNRTIAFVDRYFEGLVPKPAGDEAFWGKIRESEISICQKLERAELRDAFRIVFEISSMANKAFQDGEPWKTRKTNPDAAASLIGELCYVLRDLCVLIKPFLPETSDRIANILNISCDSLNWTSLGTLFGLTRIAKPEILFAKLEDSYIAELRERYSGSQAERLIRANKAMSAEGPENLTSKEADPSILSSDSQEGATSPAIPIEERFIKNIDLRVAKIIKVERHPKADKLYIETIELGGEERTIVSGLVPYYTEEELLNRSIIVVYNLKATKLRGVESQGMLLAASAKHDDEERVEVLSVDAPPGTRIKLQSDSSGAERSLEFYPESLPIIDIDSFFSVPIRAVNGAVMIGASKLVAEGQAILTKLVLDGEVG